MIKKHYRLKGLNKIERAERISRLVAAIHGVENVSVNVHTVEMILEAEAMMMPRIEHAAIVIISTIEPGIEVQEIRGS